MPWDCLSCKYQKHIKYQEGRIRYLELELKAARDEVNLLKNRNTSNNIKNKDNVDDIWLKPKNSKSRGRRFSADNVSHIRLSNKFSILEVDQQNQGLLKHEDMKIKSLTGKSNSKKKKEREKKERKKKEKLLLGSSHERNIGPMLQKHLGTEYEVTSIFTPNVPLQNVVEDLGNLGKDRTVIEGGPGNNLDRNCHYSIKKDLNFFARRTDHINIRFVNLLRRYDKPWMNRKVRSVNLRLDQALLGHGMSHVGVVNTMTIRREEPMACI